MHKDRHEKLIYIREEDFPTWQKLEDIAKVEGVGIARTILRELESWINTHAPGSNQLQLHEDPAHPKQPPNWCTVCRVYICEKHIKTHNLPGHKLVFHPSQTMGACVVCR